MVFQEFIRKHWVYFPAILLFIFPFFWLQSGQIDIGGDANRLYFYDPFAFIRSTALYAVGNEGRGVLDPKYYYISYVGFIAFLKLFFSSTIVIGIFNGCKLAGGYLGIVFIILELLNKEKKILLIHKQVSAIAAGVFYVIAFGSVHTSFFWDRALFTHDQLFLNPLVFFLLLKYILTNNFLYSFVALLISFIFATNFGLAGVPAFFAFYPLTIIFIWLYVFFVKKLKFPWRKFLLLFLFFTGLHAFHLLGSLVNFLEKGSITNAIVFSQKEIIEGGVNYFSAISSHGFVLLNLFLPSASNSYRLIFPFSLLIILIGIFMSKKFKKEIILITGFFLFVLYLASANITTIGYEFYKLLFHIPGFSMFRVFFEKWMFVYIFFYALLLGLGFVTLFNRFRLRISSVICFVFFIFILISGLPIFSGNVVHQVIRGSKDVTGVVRMDERYEETLRFIRELPQDGKFLVLPLTDSFRQVIAGRDGGVYEGPSTLFHLTHAYGFVGYQSFGYKDSDPFPLAEQLIKSAKNKDYKKLVSIIQILNIRYILHNNDPYAYEASFRDGSFGLMMAHLPRDQAGYTEFLSNFPFTKIYENGSYSIYEIAQELYNPTIFVPKIVKKGDFDFNDTKDLVFVESDAMNGSTASASFEMINPSEYKVLIKNIEVSKPLFLVLQHLFHSGWRLYENNREIDALHIVANGYANGWVFSPSSEEVTLYIRMDQQKYASYGIIISSIFIVIICMYAYAENRKK